MPGKNDHFPYKYDAAIALLEENPSVSPRPDDVKPGDVELTVSDHISEAIISASADHVDAQEKFRKNPDSETARQDYQDSRDALVAARQEHRSNRGASFAVNGFRSPV